MEDEEKSPIEEGEKIDEAPLEEKIPIDERIKQLKDEGYDKREMTLTLYQEGYSTQEIMKRHLPLRTLKGERTEAAVMRDIEGGVRGSGYLEEFKDMIRAQISKNKELTEVFYNLGLGTLFASLHKTGMNIEDFRKIASTKGGLKEALQKAGETAFKALEYYESDLITQVERERDEARVYSTVLETRVKKLIKDLDPRIRLEKMIQIYLLAGKADPDTLKVLMDKWLSMKAAEIKMEMLA